MSVNPVGAAQLAAMYGPTFPARRRHGCARSAKQSPRTARTNNSVSPSRPPPKPPNRQPPRSIQLPPTTSRPAWSRTTPDVPQSVFTSIKKPEGQAVTEPVEVKSRGAPVNSTVFHSWLAQRMLKGSRPTWASFLFDEKPFNEKKRRSCQSTVPTTKLTGRSSPRPLSAAF